MSKDKIADYDGTTAGNNTDIGGISIAEGMLPSAVNNSMRELTKQLGAFANGTDPIDALTVTGDLTVDTNTLHVDAANNRVGVGTAAPAELLHLNANNPEFAMQAASDGGECAIYFKDDDGNKDGRITYRTDYSGQTDNYMQFFTNGSERLRLDGSGNLLVGTTGHFNFSGDTTEITVGSAGTGTNHGGAVTFVSNNGGTTLGYVGFQEASGQIATMGSRHLTLGTNNTERMTIEDGGDIRVATAGRIVNEGGIFLGGTASANHLDDYEEGDWVPTLNGGLTPTSVFASYTKIGRMVFINCQLVVPSNTNSTFIQISGLPYTVTTNHDGGGTLTYTTASTSAAMGIQLQTTSAYFYGNGGGTLSLSTFSGAHLRFNGLYRTG
jgi:hypothetical protein